MWRAYGEEDEGSARVRAYLVRLGAGACEWRAEKPQAGGAREREEMEARIQRVLAEHGLSRLGMVAARAWVQRMIDEEGAAVPHVRQWFMCRLNGRGGGRAADPWQRGCPQIVPGLRARAVWDESMLPWLGPLREAFGEIRSELLALRESGKFQPYRSPVWSASRAASDGVGGLAHDRGNWNVFYLHLHNVDFSGNRALCPATCAAVERLPRAYEHAFFSALAPKTHVASHHGPTNKKLRVHLPLVVPEGSESRLRVGDEVVRLREGVPYVFDDSFQHEAWNDSESAARIVLIVDVWHPDLGDEEVKFLRFLQRAQLRAEREVARQHGGDNLFTILQQSSKMEAAEEEVWAGVEAR